MPRLCSSLLLSLVIASLLWSRADAVVILDDGLTHVVDDSRYASDSVRVEDSPDGSPTTLILAPGGVAAHLISSDTSRIEIAGGAVTDRIWVNAPSSLLVSAGSIFQVLAATGTIDVTGGYVDYLYLDYGTTTVTGGSIGSRFQVGGFSNAHIYGGDIDGLLVLYGGNAVVYGSDFAIDGVPQPLGQTNAVEGNVTGLYLDGSPFSFDFVEGLDAGGLVFVPEPSTGLLVITGLLGFGGWRRVRV
jgi:hypothetical protein